MKRLICSLLLTAAVTLPAVSQETSYQLPAKEVADLVMAKPLPVAIFNNDFTKAAVTQASCEYVTLARLADGELRLGGIRINSNNFSPTREKFAGQMYVISFPDGRITELAGMPEGAEIKNVKWSPSGRYLCFTNDTHDKVEIWRADMTAVSPTAERISTRRVSAIFGNPYDFLDDERIIYKSVPDNIGEPPAQFLPTGPVAQENLGKKNELRTYQDLLKSPYDAALYDYFCTSVLAVTDGKSTSVIGEPAIYRSYDLSPDRKFLIATTEHHPYSYMEGHRSFPSKTFIMSVDGSIVKMLKDGTKKKDEAESKESGRKKEPGRSSWGWRADKGAVLTWTETAPSGPDSKDKAKDEEEKPEKLHAQRIYQCESPFDFETTRELVFSPEYKLGTITWGDDGIALYTESSKKQKFRRTLSFVPCDTLACPEVLFTESTDVDSLGNFPVYGKPYTVKNAYGKRVLHTDAGRTYILLTDKRPDAEGDNMSFIDRLTLRNRKIENLWSGAAPFKEEVIAITDFNRLKFISRKQSVNMVPNFFLVDVRKGRSSQITFFEDPVPMMQDLQREFVTYKRADGLELTSLLYLPAGYDKDRDGKLPLLLWGYPYEYKCAAEAEKSRPDRYGYSKPGYSSFICWASQGYAVLQNAQMPILSEAKDKEPNDRFISELTMDAEAAINFADSAGFGDRNRVAVGGHSYGGFMTANLLARTKLFKAGIARSGAYNRSLTPFGFQHETRSYWKAKAVYDDMSPFNFADSLKTPILISHGQMDNNSGTFPIQSERLYQAVCGHGGTARFIVLPYESHSYSAQENVLHLLYETGVWLDRYVKNWKDEDEDEDEAEQKIREQQ